MTARTQPQQRRNGRTDGQPVKAEVPPELLAEAAAYEQRIADEAHAIWDSASTQGEATLTPALYRRLRPLVRRPIPEGFIAEISAGKGKPYESRGIRSLQVQVDRLDNVIGEGNWDWSTRWLNEAGTLTEVAVWIGPESAPLVGPRRARGGVDRGSTLGNTHKASETNAAKLAFARLGVGHEVYVGLTDLDPDVSEDAMRVQGEGGGETVAIGEPPKLTPEQVERVEKGIDGAGLTEHLPMKLRSMGLESLAEATTADATALWEWTHGAEGSTGFLAEQEKREAAER